MYHIIEQLRKIQAICLPEPINFEYNEQVLKKISEDKREELEHALEVVLNQDDFTREEAMVSLKLIARFSRIANNWEMVEKISQAWIDGYPNIEAGVTYHGEIVLWDVNHKGTTIKMMPISSLCME
jgi:hypothetical protein